MSELTPYDFFMEELIALEKNVYMLVQKEEELAEEKEILLKELKVLKDENEILKIKLHEAKKKSIKTDDFFDETFSNLEDKEVIKNKIDELINKIDNHLRS